MIAVGISAIPYYARVTYGVVLAERQKPYVDAAQVVGAGHMRVIVRHLLPNVLPPMIVVASLGFSAAVLSAAALSFLGLGAQPPAAEWGLMLSTGRNYITRAPWLLIAPGIAIFVTVIAFNVFGDGVRDLLDPRRRQKDALTMDGGARPLAATVLAVRGLTVQFGRGAERGDSRDDGHGLPDGFDIEKTTSLGLSIVRDLVASQLEGRSPWRRSLPPRAGGPVW